VSRKYAVLAVAILTLLSACSKVKEALQGSSGPKGQAQFYGPPAYVPPPAKPKPKPGPNAPKVKNAPVTSIKTDPNQRVQALGGLIGIKPPNGWSLDAKGRLIFHGTAVLDFSQLPMGADGKSYQLYGQKVRPFEPGTLVSAVESKAKSRSPSKLQCQYMGDVPTEAGQGKAVVAGFIDSTGGWGTLHIFVPTNGRLILFRYTAPIPVFGEQINAVEDAIKTSNFHT
jgi:hypothetical protein